MRMRNELIKTKVVLYPGMDSDLNIVAVPLANTFIGGMTGSGKTVLLKNIIKNLIQNSHKDSIDISIWDGVSMEHDIWIPKTNGVFTNERHLQQINGVVYNKEYSRRSVVSDEEYFEQSGSVKFVYQTRYEFLEDIETKINIRKEHLKDYFNCLDYISYEDLYPHDTSISRLIVIMDEFNATEDTDDKLLELLKTSERYGVYFILATQSLSSVTKEFVQLFKNKFELRMYASKSEELFSNTDLNVTLPKSDYCILHVEGKDSTLIKVPFNSDSFLRKFVGYYSVRRQC